MAGVISRRLTSSGVISRWRRSVELAVGENHRSDQRPGVEGQTQPRRDDLHPHRGGVVGERAKVRVRPVSKQRQLVSHTVESCDTRHFTPLKITLSPINPPQSTKIDSTESVQRIPQGPPYRGERIAHRTPTNETLRVSLRSRPQSLPWSGLPLHGDRVNSISRHRLITRDSSALSSVTQASHKAARRCSDVTLYWQNK